MMAELDILNGFASKIISDCLDITIDAIRKADKDRKSKNQSAETRIYQVTIDALNAFPYNKYKKTEKIYDAAESILKELKKGNCNYKESVRSGLNMLYSEIAGDKCEDFLKLLCDEMRKEENRDLAIGYIIRQGEKVIEQQKQTNEYMQERFEESRQNEKEILEEVSGVKSLIKEMNGEKGCKTENRRPIENRADEYARKWNENVFLNNFNEEDENVGTEIKLWEIYKEECLPHYIWKTNKKPSEKTLRDKLKEYIIDKQSRKMLLILGQPGIGKSTLITWIMANLVEKKEDILVYQFANDLGGINWQDENVLNDIFRGIDLEYDELENKTLILDGFDEIYAGGNRERILNKLDQELKRRNILKKFSLIITCRENYIYNLQNIKCDYIVLQPWNETQIGIFCRAYWEKCGNEILEDKIQRIMENKEIFGIPLILYMVLALDITIEESDSIVDIYDQIFSFRRGGIYDRCYDIEHRINLPEIKGHIHRISQRIAFWMFENNAENAFISQEKFVEICNSEMSEFGDKVEEIQADTLIGNFFKLKHCEGKETNELQFVHRSIYEYFVVIYFFESIHNLKSKEAVAGKIGELLKDGRLSKQILEFIKCKFDSIEGYSLSDITKDVFNMMLQNGMTYYFIKEQKEPLLNILVQEVNIFSNMLEIIHLWNDKLECLDGKTVLYVQHNHFYKLNLKGVNLRGAYLKGANLGEANLSEGNLIGANLIGADLSGADLSGAILSGAYLIEANLIGDDISGAYLREWNLEGIDLSGAILNATNFSKADLNEAVFDERQVKWLCEKYDLRDIRVYLSETRDIISYQEYCIKCKKFK